MNAMTALHPSTASFSPLEGPGILRAQRAQSELQDLGRREWWLWFSAFLVTVLSAVALLLSFIHSLFPELKHFYEVRPEQVRWGTMCLLLLFNAWLLYRQWSFRRVRTQASVWIADAPANAQEIPASSGLDPVSGLLSKAAIEQQLGKEIARARRQNTTLSLATIHLDDFADLTQLHGSATIDQALKEFARRLKEVSRGCDLAARLGTCDFVLVLPKCGLGEVNRVLNRLGPLELDCSGQQVSLAYTTGWVDYQPGDLPADLLKRAAHLLHLYDGASKDSLATSSVSS
jgi:diguanylate cyclase (GGDEF)-like protein